MSFYILWILRFVFLAMDFYVYSPKTNYDFLTNSNLSLQPSDMAFIHLGRSCYAQHNPALWCYSTVIDSDIINQAGPESAWIAVSTSTKIET